MRIKAVFTVFARRLASGKQVYYYQCYDEKGKRQWAKSTGISKKTEAVAYCMKLFREGLLIPEQKLPTFAEFSDGWWNIETCRYLKWRELHEPLSKGTVSVHRDNFKNHIKDYFSKFLLNEITPDVIENWLLHMSEKKDTKHKKDGVKKFKTSTINLAYRTLRTMLNEAVRIKLIDKNPCSEVKELREEAPERIILTVEEVKKLFNADWSKVWESKVVFLANRLAACTGLRIGELRGLKCEYVFDDYIFITGQYNDYGYIPHTKTRHNRNIPITPMIRQEIDELLKANGAGYVFSDDGGITPVSTSRINRQFDKALENIGISHEEKLKRNLSFHSWRHFLNTLLLTSNVVISKVQKVTGHKSLKMTEHYTHFDTKQFTEVRDVQMNLLAFNEPVKTVETSKPKKNGKTIIKAEPSKKPKARVITKKPVKKADLKKKKRA